MEVEINVIGTPESLGQQEAQRIRRCSSVLTEAGFNVKVNWGRDRREFQTENMAKVSYNPPKR